MHEQTNYHLQTGANENVAYFNFETNPKRNETFEENISPDYLIPILSHIAGQTIVKEKTLIVFDEVQLCERALTGLPMRLSFRQKISVLRITKKLLLFMLRSVSK